MPQQLYQQLDDAIAQIFGFLPNLAAALGILLAGFAIAKMIERGTDLFLHRIGFDRWMRDGGVIEALERAGTTLDPSTVLAKLVFWVVMLTVILVAAKALQIEAVSTLFAELLAYVPNVIAAVIVLVLGILLGEFMKDLVLASAGGLPGGPTLARAAKVSVILLSAFMALEQLDIAQDIVLVFFIAVVGAGALAAGIAFGLGAQGIAAEMSREWYERSRHHERPPRASSARAVPPIPPPSAQTADPRAAAPGPAPVEPGATPPPSDVRG